MSFDVSSIFGGKGFQDGSNYMNRPPMNVPDSEKDMEFHRKYALSIVRGSVNEQWSHGYNAMNENYRFYDGTQGSTEFKFLQEAEDGDVLPATWINFNKIRVKMDLLLGELSKKGFDIKVNAINKDAVSRKLAEKERLRVEMRLKKDREMLEQVYGMPLSAGTYVPESQEELDEYFSFKYKDNSEVVMTNALKYIARYSDWDYQRIALYRDVLIAGRSFVRLDITNEGVPYAHRRDPRMMIFDPNCEDDLLKNSTYFGEIAYESLANVVEKFQISKQELDQIYASNQTPAGGIQGGQYVNTNLLLGKSGISLFKEERGDLRVLVIKAVWKDIKFISHKVSADSYGNIHYKELSESKALEFYGTKRRDSYQIWRKATIIGGNIIRDWGIIENMGRNVDNPYESSPPYVGLAPNYVNYRSISKVEQLKGLQKLKDLTMYNMQLAMSRAGAKGFIYDLAQMPDDWDVATVIKYLKTVGIGFIDSKKDGLPSNFNQYQTIDMTLSSSIVQYIEISMMVDREMDAISGINEARQGIVQSASQAVGVTQSALLQSNLATETLFAEFEMFNSEIFTQLAKLVKVVWPENDKFAMVIGDDGLDWLNTDSDLDLQDYGVFIEFVAPSISDRQTFQGMVQMAVQAGMLDFLSGIKLLRERDVDYAIRMLERQLRRDQLEALKQQQQQAQQEQQAAMQQQQMANQQKDKEMAGKMAIERGKQETQLAANMMNGIMSR